jgi:serine kinase of HPr protein (carbohydrate metabolism regulator)
MSELFYNATCVAINGIGVLIEGAPKTGKSSLALSLIDEGAKLVSDDLTLLTLKNNVVYTALTQKMPGLIFVRGLGLLKINDVEKQQVEIKAIIRLGDKEDEFLSQREFVSVLSSKIPVFNFFQFDYALTKKIKAAIKLITNEWELKE